ncbi:hypothetical protein P755_gp089 [Mycobacterium phage Quink]|uniref:Holliday junction resolvase n=11 Tax=Caudoviricetes TaxID=2731619 RepID=Q857S5_9CAUD|nr:gp87 [Mycobacterium phage Cjw1]YP_002014554.1 hypothetical protein Kostya_86 [Mycobacterium phage Kostya]YP_008051565.1 hypothetical protein PBI_MURPHY_86 [Mycobacterium phage Murphy]YP_008052262.1 hypothetical protein M039_gp088 [Mycobacterium phage Phaux]YP_008410100.1 hypothetical protein PBI_CONTAGION_82 [Mycobacterium phage Contagion]YP_008531165.1 hypothetical protein P755_gp089 [Mycobacterium phage Quink]YP_008857577.1 hypothetical protein PHATBACTER_90 [Mycobacterium phage PhatBact
MTNRSKQKGTEFETRITNGLIEALGNEDIERRTLSGTHDRGDIAGVKLNGQRVVIECKNVATGKVLHLPQWVEEAQTEAKNDGALVGVVIHKRAGTTDPMKQWVSMTVADLVAILTGVPQ